MWTELDKTIAQFRLGGAVETPIAREKVNVAVAISDRSLSSLPDASSTAIGRSIVHGRSLERRGIVGKDPTMIRTSITVSREGNIDGIVSQQQSRPLNLPVTGEGDAPIHAADAGSRHAWP